MVKSSLLILIKSITKMNNIKDMVSGGKTASFSHYFEGDLWYKTQCGFEFPVPISDAGGATFMATEKAMFLMRYIRKHIELINTSKQAESTQL
jgi:hypothetical protein